MLDKREKITYDETMNVNGYIFNCLTCLKLEKEIDAKGKYGNGFEDAFSRCFSCHWPLCEESHGRDREKHVQSEEL